MCDCGAGSTIRSSFAGMGGAYSESETMASLQPTLGLLVIAAGGLALVLGRDAASTLRHKANSLAWLLIGAGLAQFINGSLILWGI